MRNQFLIKTHPAKSKTDNPVHLILLHGHGSNEDDLLSLAPEFPENFTFSAIRSPITLGYGSYTWYHLQIGADGTLVAESSALENARKLFANAISQAVEASGIDPGQAILLGFSQGAIMSYGYGLDGDLAVKGVIALSGRMPAHLKSVKDVTNRSTKFFIGHGLQDPVLPASGSQAMADFLLELGMSVEFHTYPIPHTISAQELADVKSWLNKLVS